MMKKAVVAGMILAVLTALLYISGIGCVWKTFLGVRCPGCGMTRAFFALLSGDLVGAFRMHAMFWSVPILFLYYLFDGKLFGKKAVDIAVLSVIALGFVANYLFNTNIV